VASLGLRRDMLQWQPQPPPLVAVAIARLSRCSHRSRTSAVGSNTLHAAFFCFVCLFVCSLACFALYFTCCVIDRPVHVYFHNQRVGQTQSLLASFSNFGSE
jgi:hypothetical protein